ncbi:Neuronal acetylcholine receptor subunit alpha-7 [Holothuria leucospilota]|uniref:Neuronal acetylcholine receptor subunit alpha-7 n=1 Tax=Holothuria leucospilota TaxID=206669 RepID=A0A9Q1CGE1_HOLLE|nr:Neuronal acetylcholine receptor subunit alpha-7 [Holothuria leucospilota]
MGIFRKVTRRLSVRMASTFIVSLLLIHERPANGAIKTASKRLVEDLLSGYGSPFVRPVKNTNNTVEVIFRAKPVWFADFDERSQILKFTALNQLKWKDELLTWNPDDYEGIKEINFGKEQIWFPDIAIMERLDVGPWKVNMEEPFTKVNFKGEVVYYYMMLISVYCKMDVTLFPFDIHDCELILIPYSFDAKEVSLYYSRDKEAEENLLKKNGVWFVSDYHAKEVEIHHLCCPEPYREIHFTLRVQRESGFYVLTFGVPSVLLSLTSVAVFKLHPESGEKISLCVNNVLVLIIFQQLLASNMPPTGDNTPIVAYYFIAVITTGFMSVLATTLVLGMYHHDASRPLPEWVRRLLRIKPVNRSRKSERGIFDSRNKPDTEPSRNSNKARLSHEYDGNKNSIVKVVRNPSVTYRKRVPVESLENGISDISYQGEWREASRKLDKILFWICMSILILVLLISMYFLSLGKQATD